MSTTVWPTPNYPPGGGFNSSIPSDQETTWNGEGYIDKLKNGLADITADPSPANIQGFLAYVINLTSGEDPNINVADVESFLSQNVDMGSLIETASLQGMESAFFLGYNGQTGEAGAAAYIAAMESALSASGSPSNSYATQFAQALEGLDAQLPQFAEEHTDATGSITGTAGAYYWSYGGEVYVWNPADSVTDTSSNNFMIWNIIQDEGPDGTPNPLFSQLANNFNTMETNWRTEALDNLLKEYKDPSIVLSLWLTGSYDSQYQSEEDQLSATTNSLSVQTNAYATTLLQQIQGFNSLTGSGAAAGAESFVNTLLSWNNYSSLNPNSSSIASNIETNTIQSILNTQIQNPNSTSSTISLGSFIQNISAGTAGYTFTSLAASLNALAQPISIPSGATASTTLSSGSQPGYLAIINAAQSGGTLVSETSQQTATNLQQVAEQDNSVLNFGSAMASSTGAGPVALDQVIANNQRTTGG